MLGGRTTAIATCCLTAMACVGEISTPVSRIDDDGTQQTRGSDDDARDDEAGGDGDDQTPGLLTGNPCPDGQPLANGLTISEVAIYQTVKSPLYQNGAWVSDRAVPVVQNKRALVRVFVTRSTSYEPHEVRGQLTLKQGDDEVTLVDSRTVDADSSDDVAESTFNFLVDPAQIDGTTQLSVALAEPDCEAESGPVEDARTPQEGFEELAAEALGKLNVVVVPVRVGTLVPDTSAAALEKMRAYLLAYYPVAEVALTVRAPISAPGSVLATDGASWSNLLNTIMNTRQSDRAADDVYYYGLIQPAASARTYCARGCILGLAPQTIRVQPSAQIALGASFSDEQTYETMVHELGHAHGRGHAPCAPGNQIDGVDVDFPDQDGTIGTWGWDARVNRLLPPSHKDIMGYCAPNWISGYTYAALAERSSLVNLRAFVKQALTVSEGQTRWHQIILYADGSARWGGGVEFAQPGGALETTTVRDASGATIAEVDVSRVPLSDSGDAFIYLPEPGARWDTVVLGDRVLRLSDVAPPL